MSRVNKSQRINTIAVFSAALATMTFTSSATAKNTAPLPPTQTGVRCFAGKVVTTHYADGCVGAPDDDGDPVLSSNFITVDPNPPYFVKTHVGTNVSYRFDGEEYNFEGADEAQGVGIANFYVGVSLLKDLPNDFKFDTVKVPFTVRYETYFHQNTSFASGYSQSPTGVNEGLTKQSVATYLGADGSKILTEQLLKDYWLGDNLRNIYGDTDNNSNVILGISDIHFLDLHDTNIYLNDIIDTKFAQASTSVFKNVFGKKGDYFAIEGQKGAACLIDTYKSNATCDLRYDPVISFDQVAFDQAMGENTFNMSDYFALSLSNGVSAAPEPSTWVMLILGFGLAGRSLRRRRKSPTFA